MKEKSIESVPIVSDKNKVIDIIFWNDDLDVKLNNYQKISASVVIMAGGKGIRLYPYTKILPKPLIPIGDFTITERIINKFTKFGCKNFYLILNCRKRKCIFVIFNLSEVDYPLIRDELIAKLKEN